MLDIRLDFIREIDPTYIQEMTEIRELFKSLDQIIGGWSDNVKDPAALRAISLARTNNEIACQYAIKSLCIIGEKKQEL